MNKAIRHTSSREQPIRKVVSFIPTHKMSSRRLRIKQWSSWSARLTIAGKEEGP